jgi:molybdenum cofactor synthesis domain-containing protein
MRAGELILEAGVRLGPGAIAAAVAAGAGRLTVARRPRVSVLCTGDELKAPGVALNPGEIHNSNGPMLAALATRAGAIAGRVERLPDDRERTVEALALALEQADVVIISGGVSVGPHDHVKPALASLGVDEKFWGVALKPGKPTWFGTLDRVLVFGLPGNPVSAFVTFSLFARPALAALMRAKPDRRIATEAALASPVSRNPWREQAITVRLEQRDGATVAIPGANQDSHRVSLLLGADALAIIPSGDGRVAAGTRVALAPIDP